MKRNTLVVVAVILMFSIVQVSTVSAYNLSAKGPGGVIKGGNGSSGGLLNVGYYTSRAVKLRLKFLLATWAFAEAYADTAEATGKMEVAGTVRAQLAASKQNQDNQQNTKVLIETINKSMPDVTSQENLALINEERAADLVKRGSLYSTAGYIALGLAILDTPKLVKEGADGLNGLSKDPIRNARDIRKVMSTLSTVLFISKNGPVLREAMGNYKKSMKAYADSKGIEPASEDDIKEFAKSLDKQ
jgi:hypothetical protein